MFAFSERLPGKPQAGSPAMLSVTIVGGNGTVVFMPDLQLGAILLPSGKSFIFMGIARSSTGTQEVNVTISDEP